MADKSARRGVTIFIDGQEVTNSVKTITGEMKKLQREQANMTIGSDEYVKHGKKIAEMRSIINEHKAGLADLTSQYGKLSKSAQSGLSKMTSGIGMFLGITTGFAVVGSLISNAIQQVLGFSKAVSELSALTGATGTDLDYLKDKAKELGAQYGKSATEIVTAMKLVGSAKPELLSNVEALAEVTDSVLLLSQATGMDLTESTKNVTTIMNQFGLAAIESDRTVNVLAAGSKFGAVEVDYLGEAISKVGTVSKSANISLEKTTAVMELFGEKGIKAEIAGTGFKSILVKLQSDTKNYTNGLFDLNKAIDNNKKISGDNIALQEKFGKEFFNVAQILFQNKARFEELTKQVTGTTTALEMAKIASDNLSGDIAKMTSSWNTFILSLEDGKGPIANAFRTLTQWVKGTLDELSKLTKNSDQKAAALAKRTAESRIESLKNVLREKSKAHQQEMEMETDPKKKQQLELDYQKKRAEYVNVEIKSNRGLAEQYADKANALAAENKQTADWIFATEKYLKGSRDINFERTKNLSIAKNDFEAKNKEIKSLRESANAYYAYTNSVGALGKALKQITPKKTSGEKPTGADKPDKNKKKKDPYKDDLKALEDFWKDDEAINKNAYAKGAIGEDVFHQFMYDNQIGFLEDKIKLQKKYGQDTTETQIAISEAMLNENEYWNNKEKAQDKDLLASKKQDVKTREELAKEIANIMERYGVDEAGRLKTQKELELKIVEEAYKQGIISATIYAETIKKINEKSLPEWANKTKEIAGGIANVAGEFSSALQGFQSAEERSIETKYQKQIDAAQKAGKDTTAIEKKKNEELAAIRAKNADSAFAIQVAMIAASTAEAAISAYASAVKVPIVGPVLAPIAAGAAVAYGLSQVAQAKAARDAAKEGYYDGGYHTPEGYTGGTDPREVRGVFPDGQPYHGDEFIANHKTTRNREVRPVLDLIDSAQKLGTASSLTRADISNALRLSPGYSDGGYRGSNTPVSPNYNDGGDTMSMAEIAAAINRLNDRLDKGIVAESVISGRTGSFEQTKKYEKLIKNASR